MAQTNKKRKASRNHSRPSPTELCGNSSCVGCQPPKKFAFKLEGTVELAAFWNVDAAEQILGEAIDAGLNRLTPGGTRDTISYSLMVFKDE